MDLLNLYEKTELTEIDKEIKIQQYTKIINNFLDNTIDSEKRLKLLNILVEKVSDDIDFLSFKNEEQELWEKASSLNHYIRNFWSGIISFLTRLELELALWKFDIINSFSKEEISVLISDLQKIDWLKLIKEFYQEGLIQDFHYYYKKEQFLSEPRNLIAIILNKYKIILEKNR